jgi:eukaryotic-like serine/threonine-protein kinase
MTSTTIGLPDRYRPLDEVGPEEQTPTGVIRCWRAKDRVLNRDVAIRVHTPSGPAAHEWIARALTAGGLANPALAMVYDASEGSDVSGEDAAPGSAAYVVNEWIEGETLAERLERGPLPDRDVRPMMRRLADGVAEAHRVGLAVGGLTPENVVLRPNGLVGLRAVPAATGTIDGDIRALGTLLENCLAGSRPEDTGAPLSGAPDLVALARRARSGEPGQGLSSVAAMAALLAERPRSGGSHGGDVEGGRRRRARDRRGEPAGRRSAAVATAPQHAAEPTDTPEPTVTAAPVEPTTTSEPSDGGTQVLDADRLVPLDPTRRPPVPPTRPVTASGTATDPAAQEPPPPGRRGDTVSVAAPAGDARAVPPVPPPVPDVERDGDVPVARVDDDRGNGWADDPYALDALADDDYDRPYEGYDGADEDADDEPARTTSSARRGLLVVGLPILVLAVVVGLAWWLGSGVLSVAGSVDGDDSGSTPSGGASASSSAPADASAEQPTPGAPVTIASGSIFDPGGDGAPENDDEVPLTFDADPATAWSTLTYQGSPQFGNLKDGVGIVYDLGSEQALAGATLSTPLPGAAVEIRAAGGPEGSLEDWPVLAQATLEESTELTFDEATSTRYVLVWVTELAPRDDAFTAELSEVGFLAAG